MVGWLIVTGRVRPSPEYLVAAGPSARQGRGSATTGNSTRGSCAVAAELGFSACGDPSCSGGRVAKVAAVAGLTPQQLTAADDRGRAPSAGRPRIGRHRPDSHGRRRSARPCSVPRRRCSTLGVIDTPPRKRQPGPLRGAGRGLGVGAAPAGGARCRATSSRCGSRCARPRWCASKACCASSRCWLARTARPRSAASPICAARTSSATSGTSPDAHPPRRRGCPRRSAGRAPRHAADLPGAPHRVGRRGRPGPGADVLR